MGISERATLSFMDALKREPLSLALVVMNLSLLGFFYILLTTIAAQRASEIALLYADKKEVRELLSQCVIPPSAIKRDAIVLQALDTLAVALAGHAHFWTDKERSLYEAAVAKHNRNQIKCHKAELGRAPGAQRAARPSERRRSLRNLA